MSKFLATALGVALLGFAGAGLAGNEPGSMTKPNFDSLDKNRDGMLDKAEVPTSHELASTFGDYDANEDGKLSRVEFNAYLDEQEEEAAE